MLSWVLRTRKFKKPIFKVLKLATLYISITPVCFIWKAAYRKWECMDRNNAENIRKMPMERQSFWILPCVANLSTKCLLGIATEFDSEWSNFCSICSNYPKILMPSTNYQVSQICITLDLICLFWLSSYDLWTLDIWPLLCDPCPLRNQTSVTANQTQQEPTAGGGVATSRMVPSAERSVPNPSLPMHRTTVPTAIQTASRGKTIGLEFQAFTLYPIYYSQTCP